jgi:hypothetical protein
MNRERSHAEIEERHIINIASVFGIKMFAPGRLPEPYHAALLVSSVGLSANEKRSRNGLVGSIDKSRRFRHVIGL